MKVKIDIDFITNIYPRKGYLLFFNHKLYKVIAIGEIKNNEKLLTCQHVFSNEIVQVNSTEAISRFIKFIARHDKITYSIIHGDYPKLLDKLRNSSNVEVDGNKHPYNGNTDELIEDILHKSMIVDYTGDIIKIYSKLSDDDNVEITNINIIDKYKLHNKTKRISKITAVINRGTRSRYVLSTKDGVIIDANRNDFKIIGKPNTKDLFTIK